MSTTAHARMTAKVQRYLDEFLLESQSRSDDRQREVADVLVNCPTCTERCSGVDRCHVTGKPPLPPRY